MGGGRGKWRGLVPRLEMGGSCSGRAVVDGERGRELGAQGAWQLNRCYGIGGWSMGRRGVRSDDELDVSGLLQPVGSDWCCTIPILPE